MHVATVAIYQPQFLSMAPKRNQPDSAAELPQSPKKRASQGSTDSSDVAKKGKRKIKTLEDETQEILEKEPKRPASRAVTRRVTKEAVAIEADRSEIEGVAVAKKVRAIRRKSATNETAEVVIAKPVRDRVPRKEKALIIASVAAVNAPSAPVPSSRSSSISPPLEMRKDGRQFYVPLETSENEGELIVLWQQYWSTIDLCFTTVSPLFLVLILTLYAASSVTNSQIIASIALVYVFLFLIIMSSYFFAIVPFILASNTIGNILAPSGTGSKSSQKVFTRLFLLFILTAVVIGSSTYGFARII